MAPLQLQLTHLMARQPPLVRQAGLLLLSSLSFPGQTRAHVAVMAQNQAASTLEHSARVTLAMLEELLHLDVSPFRLDGNKLLFLASACKEDEQHLDSF